MLLKEISRKIAQVFRLARAADEKVGNVTQGEFNDLYKV